MLPKLYEGQDCALARALEIVGERWSMLIVRDAFYGVDRFGAFQGHLGIPRAVLADRLRVLTDNGVLACDLDPRDMRRRRYGLTEKGAALWSALYALRVWGEQYYAAPGGARRMFKHAQCGTRLDAHGNCRRCGGAVPASDVIAEPGPGLAHPAATDAVSAALRRAHRLGSPLDTRTAEPISAPSDVHAG